MIRTLFTGLCAAGAGLASAAAQPETEGPPAGDIPRNFISGGVATAPDYAGSDDYRLLPFGAARLELGDVVLQTEGPGLSATVFERGPVSAGPFARYYGGRDDDVEDAAVAALPEVDGSAVVGGFIDVTLAEAALLPRDRVSLGARAGLDAAGTFSGPVWTGSLDYGAALSRKTFLAASLSVSGFSGDYAETHFSIDPAGAAASGLDPFEAEGGVRDVGLTVIFDYGITQYWSVTAAGGYSRLLGDFADSPIVSERGSADQLFAGVGIGRRF